MKTLRKVARIKRFRSLVIDLPNSGRHGEDTVRITFEPFRGKHRPTGDDITQAEKRTVWELRAEHGKDLWESTRPRHLRSDREASPLAVAA